MFRADLASLVPGRDFSRRDFVRTAVGSGFAAAVLPVSAQTDQDRQRRACRSAR